LSRSKDQQLNTPTPREMSVSLYGERSVPPVSENMDPIVQQLMTDGALGLILVDATPLCDIERYYGARPFRKALEALSQRISSRLSQKIGQRYCMVSAAMEEEILLFFVYGSRTDAQFFGYDLPLLTRDLREFVSAGLKRIVYPYLIDSVDLPVGRGVVFCRPFQRPETQIRELISRTLEASHFEVERATREKGDTLERILLEEALSNVYEPIIELADHTVIGYEALIRGPHASGLETPAQLFSVAYKCNLEYELDSLCRRLALRNARGIEPRQKLFLNILPTSIHDPDFSGMRIRDELEQIDLAPQNLVLEISEREAISNFKVFREAIGHFSNLGFGIALDDIGSGYSSLETALELAPDYLKIDMSLVRGINDQPPKQELLRGLQGLAEKLQAALIAEGIETEEELDAIRELSIKCGQGYAIGRGAPFCGSPDDAS